MSESKEPVVLYSKRPLTEKQLQQRRNAGRRSAEVRRKKKQEKTLKAKQIDDECLFKMQIKKKSFFFKPIDHGEWKGTTESKEAKERQQREQREQDERREREQDERREREQRAQRESFDRYNYVNGNTLFKSSNHIR
jgi:hypothetical protein